MRVFLPLRFRKAGTVWCGGAGETHWPTCYNLVTPCKPMEFLKSPCFRMVNVRKKARRARKIRDRTFNVYRFSTTRLYSESFQVPNCWKFTKRYRMIWAFPPDAALAGLSIRNWFLSEKRQIPVFLKNRTKIFRSVLGWSIGQGPMRSIECPCKSIE